MMYILFLAFLYKLQGGSVLAFFRQAAGIEDDPDNDKSTAPPPAAAETPSKPSTTASGVLTYHSDGSVGARSVPDDAAGGEETDTAPLFLSASKASNSGTFSGSYQQLPVDEESGNAGFRSLSVNSDGGGGRSGIGAGVSVSVHSDGIGEPDTAAVGVLGSFESGRVAGSRAVASDGASAASAAGSDGGANAPRVSWFLSKGERQLLKRRTILARFSPIMLLSSFVSDLDLITDWCFLQYGLANQGLFIRRIALFFAIVGSVMWALSTTEFALMSKLKVVCRRNALSRLEHVGLGWQLLANVFMEDLPQFIITVITKPSSVTGVLNLATSGLSLSAKIVKGFSDKQAPSLSTQFKMVDQDPVVTRHLFAIRDAAKKEAAKAEKLVYLAWANRCCTGEAKTAVVFQAMQLDSTFVMGDLDYMRADLIAGSKLLITSCGLKGVIPKGIGELTVLRAVVLRGNSLEGDIPVELGELRSLTELDLSDNLLSGPIPAEIGQLHLLQILRLSGNALTGVIPTELGALSALTNVVLAHNELTGEIPLELTELSALEELDLSRNELTGSIPGELGNLTNLQTLSLGSNKLSGPIPESLGLLAQLKSFAVADNMLTGAEDAEEALKLVLHPECDTDFLPQHEEEEKEEETA